MGVRRRSKVQVHLLKTVAFSRISISQDIKQLKLNSDPFFSPPCHVMLISCKIQIRGRKK